MADLQKPQNITRVYNVRLRTTQSIHHSTYHSTTRQFVLLSHVICLHVMATQGVLAMRKLVKRHMFKRKLVHFRTEKGENGPSTSDSRAHPEWRWRMTRTFSPI